MFPTVRPQLTLVTTGLDPSRLATTLHLLGAQTIPLPLYALEPTLRRGPSDRLIADAVVIDGRDPAGSPAWADQEGAELVRAANAALAVRRLPDSAAMCNGNRWNGVPVLVVARDEAMVAAARWDGALRGIMVTAPTYGWEGVYDELAGAVREYILELIDEKRSLGWTIVYENGAWVQHGARLPRRRHGTRPLFESRLYDGTVDCWFAVGPQRKRMHSVLRLDERGVAIALRRFQALLDDPRATEAEFQRFFTAHPFLLEAARFELLSHPRFVRTNGKVVVPDYVVHRYRDTDLPSRVVELKRPDFPLVHGSVERPYFSQPVNKAMAQVLDYGRMLTEPTFQDQVDRVFGDTLETVSLDLVIGRARQLDPEMLKRAQEARPDVRVIPFDELFSRAATRFVS
jgi:hypothetical protein